MASTKTSESAAFANQAKQISNTIPWKPESYLLDIPPSQLITLPEDRPDDDDDPSSCAYPKNYPRIAKNTGYVTSVQKCWSESLYKGIDTAEDRAKISSVGRPHLYHYNGDGDEEKKWLGPGVHPREGQEEGEEEEGVTFYGHVVRPPLSNKGEKLPGVVIFQTGGGPHDLFFRWKADELARGAKQQNKPCIVLIADVLSDRYGWGWDNDKSYYGSVRKELLKVDDETGHRQVLRERVRLSIDTLKSLEGVDPNNIGVLGWCLGGQMVMEVVRMKIPGVRCLAWFHGVLDGICDTKLEEEEGDEKEGDGGESAPVRVLMCNGGSDPLLDPDELSFAKSVLTNLGPDQVQWTSVDFGGVKHSFTNPAMDYNPSPKMEYSPSAAKTSWDMAMAMMGECLL